MPLRGRGGAQVQYPQSVVLPVRPIGGLWAQDPDQETPVEVSPDMLNCTVRRGQLRKRMGYEQYPPAAAAIGTSVIGLYSTQDVEAAQFLFAVHPTGAVMYNAGSSVWTALTGPALTGGADKLFVFANSQNSIVFSQGVDPVMRMPFTGTTYAALDAGAVAAQYLTRAAGRLLLGHTYESSVSKPFRIRFCVRDTHTDWTGIGSGFRDCSEFPHHLKGLKKLGAGVAVYYDKAIELASQSGMAAAPLVYDVRIADIGLYAPATLQGRNDLHMFVGNDNVYTFNGVQLDPIGEVIRDALFYSLNTIKLDRCFAEIISSTQEYLIFLCTSANPTPNVVWVYHWGRKIWYPWSVSGPSCSATHYLETYASIDELVGTIAEQNWLLSIGSLRGSVQSLLTGHTDGKVYRWGEQFLGDNGTTIPCRWTSKDFTGKDVGTVGHKITLKAIRIAYEDTGVRCVLKFYFSTDGGATWTDSQSVVLPAKSTGDRTAVVWHQVTGDRIRFKFENNTATETFRIQAFYLQFEPRSSPIYP